MPDTITPKRELKKPTQTIADQDFSSDTAYILGGDKFDRRKFEALNDSEFTELISSIEGIGIAEFFSIYEELKDQIPGGNGDFLIGLTDFDEAKVNRLVTQWFNFFDYLKTVQANPKYPAEEVIVDINERVSGFMTGFSELLDSIKKISDLIIVDPGQEQTHAYLVANSLPRVVNMLEKFKAIFNALVALMESNQELILENERLRRENASLKKQVEQLNDIILKLTAATSSTFQVIPDLFTTETGGSVFKAGNMVQVVVCGSADYAFAPGRGFESGFVINKVAGTSIHNITTKPWLEGQTAYITATSNETPKATEQIVFVFPGKTTTEPGLADNVPGSVIVLYLPDATSDMNTFLERGYKNSFDVIIDGGTHPYSIINSTPGGDSNGYVKIVRKQLKETDTRLVFTVLATRRGIMNTGAITVTSDDGKSVSYGVRVNEIHVGGPDEKLLNIVIVKPTIFELTFRDDLWLNVPVEGTFTFGLLIPGENTDDPNDLTRKITQLNKTATTPYRIKRHIVTDAPGMIEGIRIDLAYKPTASEVGDYVMMIHGGENSTQSFEWNGQRYVGGAMFIIRVTKIG